MRNVLVPTPFNTAQDEEAGRGKEEEEGECPHTL